MLSEPVEALPARAVAVVESARMHDRALHPQVALVGLSEVDPVGGLVDRAPMPLAGVGVADNQPQARGLAPEHLETAPEALRGGVATASSEGNAHELAGFSGVEPERPGEVSVGAAAEEDGADETTLLPDADADQLAVGHGAAVVPAAHGVGGGFVGAPVELQLLHDAHRWKVCPHSGQVRDRR